MSVTYGTAELIDGRWHITCEPHVTMMAKRVFRKIATTATKLSLPADDETCRDLEWFISRYPLEISDRDALRSASRRHVDKIRRIDEILAGTREGGPHSLAIEPRPHQLVAKNWFTGVKRGLLGDEVGLGKTCSSILCMADGNALPAVVVAPKHLLRQWRDEIARFAPKMRVKLISSSAKNAKMADRRGRLPDVVLISYSRLSGWIQELEAYVKFAVFEEAQELRHSGTQKSYACSRLSKAAEFCIGLSATPIYGYGSEIWNVMNVIDPGRLGNKDEFIREWCTGDLLKDDKSFGSWLRSNHIMLRRTRQEVGRVLPEIQRITHTVDCNAEDIQAIQGKAGELARIILAEEETRRGAKMSASSEFDNLLRQATGIAKAPYVAAFADMMIQSGEKVILFGWHHAVYDIWMECLKEHNPVKYTGDESPAQKQEAVRKFREGESKCFIMSLRAGAGVDGLQYADCSVGIVGELDWSPAVHDQCIGRYHRDGQAKSCMAYFLVASDGIDPIMAEVLGLKAGQLNGILGVEADKLVQRVDSTSFVRRLAEKYASKIVS
jgi:SNF2 family DNA or RNA helicase